MILSTHIAVRVSYPERGDYNWYEALATYAKVGCVEVAFYRPELFLQGVAVGKEVYFNLGARPRTGLACHCEERSLRRSNPQMRGRRLLRGACHAALAAVARNDICPKTEMHLGEGAGSLRQAAC